MNWDKITISIALIEQADDANKLSVTPVFGWRFCFDIDNFSFDKKRRFAF
jgi:hypothetical protein